MRRVLQAATLAGVLASAVATAHAQQPGYPYPFQPGYGYPAYGYPVFRAPAVNYGYPAFNPPAPTSRYPAFATSTPPSSAPATNVSAPTAPPGFRAAGENTYYDANGVEYDPRQPNWSYDYNLWVQRNAG